MGIEKHNNYISYRYGQLKETGLWNTLKRMIGYFRKYFLISRIIRYTAYIIAVIETSATLIIFASVLLITLPIGFILFGITSLIAVLRYKKQEPIISKEIAKAEKLIFINAPKGYNRKKPAYLNRMAKCFRNEGYMVFVISGSFISDTFITARKIEDGLWVIKLNYYFVMKKKLLSSGTENSIYIY